MHLLFYQNNTRPWKKQGRNSTLQKGRPRPQTTAAQQKTSRIEAFASPRPAGYLLLRSHKPLLLGFPHFRSKRFIGRLSLETSNTPENRGWDQGERFTLEHWNDPFLN